MKKIVKIAFSVEAKPSISAQIRLEMRAAFFRFVDNFIMQNLTEEIVNFG